MQDGFSAKYSKYFLIPLFITIDFIAVYITFGRSSINSNHLPEFCDIKIFGKYVYRKACISSILDNQAFTVL